MQLNGLICQEISPQTDKKCFMKACVKGRYKEDEEFEDDSTPLTDLVSLMASARRKIDCCRLYTFYSC